MSRIWPSSVIIGVIFLFISNNSNATVTCAKLKSVSAGEFHSLALADNNSLFACGDNGFWESGLGSSVSRVSSLKHVKGENGVGFLKNIVSFDAGWMHSLASDVNGTIWAWGRDYDGRLGNGAGLDDNEFPARVLDVNGTGYLNHIVYVSAGRSGKHSLAVDSNGYVYAWGNNDSGQCGDGTSGTNRDIPVRVLDDNSLTQNKYLGDVAHIIQVDAGVDQSIALDSNGHVWHWGAGSSTGTYPEKVKASSAFGGQVLSNIIGISSCNHSRAVDSNGYVWEWFTSNSAIKVPGGEMNTPYLQNIAEVSSGYLKAMARTRDGFVLVWDEVQNPESPVYITDGQMNTPSGRLEGIISIADGYNTFRLAIDVNGRGWGWGINTYGQLGVGDYTNRAEPTLMSCAETSDSNGIIYVDKDANGLNNGTSWDNAYRDFDDALYEAALCAGVRGSCEVWVAAGTYEPNHTPPYYDDDTFLMPQGNIAIRGHFGGKGVYETSPNQRNFNNDVNETILSGDYGSGQKAYYTVTCDNTGDGLLLDGFTFTGGNYAGLYTNNHSNPSIIRCKFTGNSYYGIYADNYSYPDVTDSNFLENGIAGIYSYGSARPWVKNCIFDGNNTNSYGLYGDYSEMIVENCIIKRQSYYGMYFTNSNLSVIGCKIENNGNYGIYSNNCEDIVIKDNWIYHNGAGNYDSGLYFSYSISPPFVRNNTIVGNTYGIYVAQGRDPCLINDIIWQNGDGPTKNVFSEQGLSGVLASYCDIGGGFSGPNNINCDPCFVNANANDFHLKYASLCIDAGDPNLNYDNETDIDGQCRVIFGKSAERADIGADEFAPKADYNGDSIVNFLDFANLAAVWKSTNSPSISLDGNDVVDIYDLKQFCEYWLWYAPCFPLYEMLAEQSEEESGMAAGIEESMELVGQTLITESAKEPVTNESSVAEEATEGISQPVSDEQIQIMIDWLEQIWQTDPELQETIDPNDYQRFIDLLREELND